jgi:ribosomal protein L11 methyltransferase
VCESPVETSGRTSQNKTSLLILNRIPQGDWAFAWKKYFKPFFLTPEIVIRPSWEEYKIQRQEKVIVIDPGMAFGTGQHDTTKFCAELICELKHDHPELKSLIDVGCGSGILSFIAKKVGFTSVVGFDIDPESIEACLENLERNPDLGEIEFLLNDGQFSNSPNPLLSRGGSNVVVANIIAETLCEMKEQLLQLMTPKGYLILSGIMTGREKMIADCFGVKTSGRTSLQLITRKDSLDWHATLYHQK